MDKSGLGREFLCIVRAAACEMQRRALHVASWRDGSRDPRLLAAALALARWTA